MSKSDLRLGLNIHKKKALIHECFCKYIQKGCQQYLKPYSTVSPVSLWQCLPYSFTSRALLKKTSIWHVHIFNNSKPNRAKYWSEMEKHPLHVHIVPLKIWTLNMSLNSPDSRCLLSNWGVCNSPSSLLQSRMFQLLHWWGLNYWTNRANICKPHHFTLLQRSFYMWKVDLKIGFCFKKHMLKPGSFLTFHNERWLPEIKGV